MPSNSNNKRTQGSGVAEAQAQKERQEQLSLLRRLKFMLIFPSATIKPTCQTGMKIYQLDSATRDFDTNETIIKDPEAYDLTMWLESGVFEAVELKYLRRMEFIIMSPEHENPREAYSFDLTYPDDPRDGAVVFSGTKVTTVASTKGQLVKLIRSLIAFGNTLGELPRERILNVKLWYFDNRTPEGWQPKHFREADPSELKFSKGSEDPEIDDKLKIKIGDLATPHHTLSLRFTGYDHQEQQQAQDDNDTTRREGGKSVSVSGESDENDDARDGENPRTHQGRWTKQQGGLLTCKVGPEEADDATDVDVDHHDDDEETDVDDEQTETPAAAIAERDGSRMVSSMMSNLDVSSKDGDQERYGAGGSAVRAAESDAYDTAKAWAITRTRPTHTGLMAHMEISREMARQFLERMVREGLFVKRNFKYHRVDPPQASGDAGGMPSNSDVTMGVAAIDKNTENEDETCSSQNSSVSAHSSTQVPESLVGNNTPSSMPPPAAPPRHDPEQHYATPPIPTSAPSGLKAVPEKPPRTKMVTMGTKRVLDELVLSGHDDVGNGHPDSAAQKRLQDDEPIDVFNTENEQTGSESGYERMALSQSSTTSVTGRPRRKCSLAINPIHQFVPSKRLRVDVNQGKR